MISCGTVSLGGVMKRNTWILSTSLVLLSTLLLVVFSLSTLAEIERVYKDQTALGTEALKRQFLYHSVNNQIKRIDTQRAIHQVEYQKQLDHITWHMDTAYEADIERFPQVVASFFTQDSTSPWTAVLWQRETGEVIVDNKGVIPESEPPIDVVNSLLHGFQLYELHSYTPYTLFVGIPQVVIDEEVKQYIADEIYSSEYPENSYIWVNEVINYEGGDNYAIRRIHPNLRDSVGVYLSTNMTDVQGNTPYKTELEGINQDGELYFTYFFKKLDSDVISEKLTYARLYKDFDWIVAMGLHLDDLAMYVEETANKSAGIVDQITPIFIGAIILLFVLHSVLLVVLEHQRNKKQSKNLEDQAYRDPLTGIGNRRSGLIALKKAYLESRKGNGAGVISIFDIDYFKHINDAFGHDAGDRCLIQLTKTLQEFTCSTNALFRWGGDEFLLVCPPLTAEQVNQMAESLLSAARTVEVEHETTKITMTISLGFASFLPSDKSEIDTFKRADGALYQAKEAGRNRFVTLL